MASIASTKALTPGTETSAIASEVRRKAAAVVRGGASSLEPLSRRFPDSASALATPASAASSEPSSVRRTATTMSLGVASAGTSKPIPVSTSTLSAVAIATWAAATPSTSWTARLTWRSVTESAYAPRRSSTWLSPSVMQPPSQVPRARAGRPRPGHVRSCARSVRPARPILFLRATPRTRAPPLQPSRTPAAWPTAAWSSPPASRTAASTSGVAMPGAPGHREPAAEHVVAVRRQPVAAAHQRGDVDGTGLTRSGSRGTLTSTSRPTTTGSSPRCSTPPRTDAVTTQAAGRARSAARTEPRLLASRPRRHTGRPRRRTPRPARGAAPPPDRRPPTQMARHTRGRAHGSCRISRGRGQSSRDTYRRVIRRSHHQGFGGCLMSSIGRVVARPAPSERHVNVDVQVGGCRTRAR